MADSTEQDPNGEQPAAPEEDEERRVLRLQRRRAGEAGDLELREAVTGSRPGTSFLRLTRRGQERLRRVAPGEFEATERVLQPTTAAGRFWTGLRHALLGAPLRSSELSHERLSKIKALAVFSSDNLSSSAYATEEILLILILAGAGALSYSLEIAGAIALLAVIVATSYRQMVRAYPGGGGAYAVTKENLGVGASLLTGATLLVDYILTVAVSTAAGVAAITSALPEVYDLRIEIAVGFVVVLTLANLRGIRESGTLFAIPTYVFIFSFGAMIVVGLVRIALGHDLAAAAPENPIAPGAQVVTAFLLMRAFSSGAAALTGIEAIADGVAYFKPPESRNAAITLTWMALILGSFFVGTTVLAHEVGVLPSETRTVVSQIAETVFGKSVFFYVVQVSTAMILVLAANTSFAGLPALASIMAKDGVMPRQFAFRGDRLAFSNGIIVLGIASSILLVIFGAATHKLIPLYAFGVFMAFTLSQAGLVLHWRALREPGWRGAALLNAVGAVVTGVVAIIVGATKFLSGAWISMAIMVALLVFLWRIRNHYLSAREQLEPARAGADHDRERAFVAASPRSQNVVVPVDELNRAVLGTIAYARSISNNVVALHVTDDRVEAEALKERWDEVVLDVPLVIIESPYRSLVEPIMEYVDAVDRSQPGQPITVVLPEFVTHMPWHGMLHNQLSQRLKRALVHRPNTVVVDVPYHLER